MSLAKFFRYAEDYISSVKIKIPMTYIIYNKNSDLDSKKFDPESIYIFCQEIPTNVVNKINRKIILNMEQLTRSKYLDQIKSYMDQNIIILDYAIENIKLLKILFPDNLTKLNNYFYIPYQYNKNEFSKLRKFRTINKSYDIAFSGSISQKRDKILKQLKQLKLKVYVVPGWRDVRDSEIGKCKILLNIHFNNDYNIFEHMRCDRWAFSEMLIVSEKTIDYQNLDIKDLVIFEDYNNLVNKTVDVIKNYDKYYADFMKKHNNLYKKILHERKLKLLEFVSKLS